MIGPASTTCSKLSRTSRTRRVRSHVGERARRPDGSPPSTTPTADAIRGATSSGRGSARAARRTRRRGTGPRPRSPAAGRAGSCRSRRARSRSAGGSSRAGRAASSSSSLASDEGRELGRQVVRPGVEASAVAGSSDGSPSAVDLDQPFGRQQVAEAVLPEVAEGDAGWAARPRRARGSRPRRRSGPPCADGRDPRGAVDVEADQAAAGLARPRPSAGPSGRATGHRRATARRRAPAAPRRPRRPLPGRSRRRRRTSRPRCPARRRRGLRTPRAGSRGAVRAAPRSARCRSAPRGWSSPRCR